MQKLWKNYWAKEVEKLYRLLLFSSPFHSICTRCSVYTDIRPPHSTIHVVLSQYCLFGCPPSTPTERTWGIYLGCLWQRYDAGKKATRVEMIASKLNISIAACPRAEPTQKTHEQPVRVSSVPCTLGSCVCSWFSFTGRRRTKNIQVSPKACKNV